MVVLWVGTASDLRDVVLFGSQTLEYQALREKLANAHFWLGVTTTGVYMISMWAAGITR